MEKNIIGKQLKLNIDMEVYKRGIILPEVIEIFKSIGSNRTICRYIDNDDFKSLSDDCRYSTIAIIYPKGKRPDLGYPVNNKLEVK